MIYTNSDGGSRGNPGNGAVGVVIRDEEKILKEYSEILEGKVTNNVAEYHGLIRALSLAKEFTNKEITCILDSELIVKQLLGEYRVRNEFLMTLFLKVQELENNFEKINYIHKRREDKWQKHADWLLNKALDSKFGKKK